MAVVNLEEVAIKAKYEAIQNVLSEVKGNKSKAAIILGVDRKTIYNLIMEYNKINL